MAKKRPQGDHVGWRTIMKHFQLAKNAEMFYRDKQKPILLMLAAEFESMTSQSFSGGYHTWV